MQSQRSHRGHQQPRPGGHGQGARISHAPQYQCDHQPRRRQTQPQATELKPRRAKNLRRGCLVNLDMSGRIGCEPRRQRQFAGVLSRCWRDRWPMARRSFELTHSLRSRPPERCCKFGDLLQRKRPDRWPRYVVVEAAEQLQAGLEAGGCPVARRAPVDGHRERI